MPLVPKQFEDWPSRTLPIDELIRRYERGYPGALYSPEARERLHETIQSDGGKVEARDACSEFAGSHEGQLVLTFTHVEHVFPGCWPASAQARGDCVSHSTRNACLTTAACEIASGEIDPVSGKPETVPDGLTDQGRKDGVFSTESLYWFRDHGGDGWFCPDSVRVAIDSAGLVTRKAYPFADLTRYDGKTAGKWGRTSPPAEVRDQIDDHRMRTATEADSFEEVRDLLGNGYGVTSCGSEGFSSERDENGVSRRKGSWAHAMAYIAADDRPDTHRRYGGPLVCVLNSWGRWNKGPRRIAGTDQDIPEGSFWAKWSDLKRRNATAISGANGWPAKNLPDYNPGWS